MRQKNSQKSAKSSKPETSAKDTPQKSVKPSPSKSKPELVVNLEEQNKKAA